MTPDRDDLTGIPENWPPPVYLEAAEQENTSGAKSTVPVEIQQMRWNWGAFFLGPIWAFAHSIGEYGFPLIGIFLGAVMTIVNGMGVFPGFGIVGGLFWLLVIDLIVRCNLARRGNSLAWRNRHFPGGVTQFVEVQRIWLRAGSAIFISVTVVGSYMVYNIVRALTYAFTHM